MPGEESFVDKISGTQDVQQPEGKRRIAAGPELQMNIGPLRRRMGDRVDDNDAAAGLLRLAQPVFVLMRCRM